MKFAIAPPVTLRNGIASTHFVKYPVAIRIHMYPRDGGLTGTTKSIPLSVEGPWDDHAM